jgi:hypothetical protein
MNFALILKDGVDVVQLIVLKDNCHSEFRNKSQLFVYKFFRENVKVAFVPPNPKLLDMAV